MAFEILFQNCHFCSFKKFINVELCKRKEKDLANLSLLSNLLPDKKKTQHSN